MGWLNKYQKAGQVDPGYSDPDVFTGTTRIGMNKIKNYANSLLPAHVLNQAADMAERNGFKGGADNSGYLDAVRHASAAASAAARFPVPGFIKSLYPQLEAPMREYGSRGLGAIQEFIYDTPEGKDMDYFNNKVGAQIGSIPGLTDLERNKLIIKQLKAGKLQVDNKQNIKKANGGLITGQKLDKFQGDINGSTVQDNTRVNTGYGKQIIIDPITGKPAVGNRLRLLLASQNPKRQSNVKAYDETGRNIGKAIRAADVVTDVMQLGNFIPHPVAQSIAKAGNIIGGAIDLYQTGDNIVDGNYVGAALNAASLAIPIGLIKKGYKRDMQNTLAGTIEDKIASYGSRYGNFTHLTAFPQHVNNPAVIKGLNFNRGLLGALGTETLLDAKEQGGVITDLRGQWDHPGKITRIPSNKITMDGVPYPVMGISDTGDTQMMYPGKDYSFDGASVTEYPMMSEGGEKDRAIVCSNCGWSWKQSNAGADALTCHKCGGENTGKVMIKTMQDGGWLQKYQGDTNGSTVKENPAKYVELPEVVVTPTSERISKQREIIQSTRPKKNYSIVDKKNNLINYYDPSGELISTERIITGASNNDLDVGKSMKDFFKENDTDSHEEYFKYLKDAKNQTTPSGIYNISGLRTDTAKNPDKIGALFNKIFRPERERQIEEIRLKDYGQQQKLFTLQSEFGVPSSKAIHGTMREDRIAAFQDPSKDRNMSNGCINVNGKTMCFDTLEKGSGVYILPEETEDLLYPSADAKNGRKTNSTYAKTRATMSDALFSRGIKPTKEALDFIAAVAEKESRGGRSKVAALEKLASYGIAKSQGVLQINPNMDAFGKYIPDDFDGSLETSAEAVHNFYNQYKDLSPEKMYQEYTGGKDGRYDKAFGKVFNRMSKVYEKGGQHGGLDRWFAEKWVDVKTGKECGRQKGEDRDYPACRPSKRVSAATPKTASELSSSEKAKFKREKQSSKRIDYNHKKENGGQTGWLDNYK